MQAFPIFIIDYKIFIIVSHNLYHRLQDLYHCFLKSLSLLYKSFSLILRTSLSLFPTIFIIDNAIYIMDHKIFIIVFYNLYHCFLQSLPLLPTIFRIFKRLLRSKIFINVYKKTRRSHLQYFVNFSFYALIERVLKHLFSRFLQKYLRKKEEKEKYF